MQSSSNELSTQVSGIKCKKTNATIYDVVRLLAERSDTKSNLKLGGFRSQVQVSYVFSHTEEFWFHETVFLWMTIYIYMYSEIRRTVKSG